MDEKLLEYFIERTDERLEKVDEKLDSLLAFKWQIIGVTAATSVIVGAGIQILIAFLTPH